MRLRLRLRRRFLRLWLWLRLLLLLLRCGRVVSPGAFASAVPLSVHRVVQVVNVEPLDTVQQVSF
jgi:hypothetical protein